MFTEGLEQLDEILDIIRGALIEINFPNKAMSQVLLSAEEVFCNIINHAYLGEKNLICFSYKVSSDPLSITIRFLDYAKPFNILTCDDPDLPNTVEEREVGGLGIYLVKKNMDEIKYDYEKGNILTLTKYAK